jgi:hypothetical protein
MGRYARPDYSHTPQRLIISANASLLRPTPDITCALLVQHMAYCYGRTKEPETQDPEKDYRAV